jgi:hypothetical protein
MYFYKLVAKNCLFPVVLCLAGGCSKVSTDGREQAADLYFELLSPEKTGVNFSNHITETFQQNVLLNSYLYNGGGVAVTDVNNDGLPDLYFTATQASNRLFLNKGNLRFEDITESAGVGALGGIKTGVTVADVNADGYQDLYVCRSGMLPTPDRANLLFVNNGDLTYSEKAAAFGLDDRSASNHANFFDYDLDGDLDVYVLNHPVQFQEVNHIQAYEKNGRYFRKTDPLDEWESDKLFRNEGHGRFTNVSDQAGIRNRAWGLSVTVSDFNSDRYPDIFVGSDYIEPDILYINNRNGTFSAQTERYFRHTSNHTMGADVADVNNDGLIDLVALDMIARDNQRQKQLMTTMLHDRYYNLVRFGYGHQVMRNVLQLNTGAAAGDGAPFSEIGVLAGISNTDWSWGPLLADFDNDGLKDLYIANGYRRDLSNLDYLTYTVDSLMRSGGINEIRFKTIDEYLRLIPSTPLQNYLFKNKDGLTFQDVSTAWGLGQTSFSNGCVYADLDADGDLELIVHQLDHPVLIYKNLSSEKNKGNWLQIKLAGQALNPAGVGARLRITGENNSIQYQEMTPTRGFFSAAELLFHVGLGAVTNIRKLEIEWPPDGRMQVLENLPINQRITLNYQDAKPGHWEEMPAPAPFFHIADNTGIDFHHDGNDFMDFNRERLIPHRFSNLGPHIAVGDVNKDGLDDFYIGGGRNQAGALFLQQSGGTFRRGGSQPWQADAALEDMGSIFFDADGDGDDDLYVVSGGSASQVNSPDYQDRLYFNDGKGNFAKAAAGILPVLTASGSCVTAQDFDADGDKDIFVGGLVTPGFYPTAPRTCVLQNEGGRFTEVGERVAPELIQVGMVRDMAWADLDMDGNAELLVAGEWLPITVFKNRNGKLENVTAGFGLQNTNGWWNCVQPADLDGDGDLDIVAGNLGLNSRYKATDSEPLRLFYRDFDNNGSLDPILAWYQDGKLYPVPQRDMIIKQIPLLKKKFVRYCDYGKATLMDVFSSDELRQAQQFEAKTFASCWFENQGGKFMAHPLPNEAQFAPCHAVLVRDFNGDRFPDILAVGNDYGMEVETGRQDAGNGVFLLGDGRGNFSPVSLRQSGFRAMKEARDMVEIKRSNGKPLFLIANYDDKAEGVVAD